MSDLIQYQKDGPVARITLNRPDIGNKVTDAMAVELTQMLTEAGRDSQVVLFQGAGDDFCLGRDTMGPRKGPPPEALDARDGFSVVFDAYNAFRGSPAPVIGVVRGRAIGFGCALAAVCDVTIAADDAQFQLPEMAHHIMPTMAMSSLIDRAPRKAINYMTWSTALIGAERALSFGIVSEVVPAAELDKAVDDLLAAMLKAPLVATRAVKEFTRSALSMDIHSANDYARNLHATINTSSRMRG